MIWVAVGCLGLIALSVVTSFILEGLRIYTEVDRIKQAEQEGWDHEDWRIDG